MGFACDALNLFDPTHDPEAKGQGRQGPNGLCAALQSAEITGFAEDLHGGAKGTADAVARLERRAKAAGMLFQVSSAVLQGRKVPMADELSGHLATFAKTTRALEQAAKDAGKPLRGMQASAAQVEWVLAMVSAIDAASEAATELAANPQDFQAAARHARATAAAFGQASVIAGKLPPPLNTVVEPLFSGIPQVVDQVVGLIEARVARIDAEAGFGSMQGAVCFVEGKKPLCTGPAAREVCFHGADPKSAGCEEHR